MAITWFGLFRGVGRTTLPADAVERVLETVSSCRDVLRAEVYEPATTTDPYAPDAFAAPPAADRGLSPFLALELAFSNAASLEANLGATGPLASLADRAVHPMLADANVEQQAMLARYYIPADVQGAGKDREPPPLAAGIHRRSYCTYLVHYPGPAENEHDWHRHYIANHPAIMLTFPAIQFAAVYTPATVVSDLPYEFSSAMQRNKVVFRDQSALTAALASSVRDDMRRDFLEFPAYEGGNAHFPMHTTVIMP